MFNGYYNNGGYLPYGSTPTYTQPNSIQISYTNGLTGAKGYSIPPNTTMFLMDSDAPQFFIKTSDRNGMCTIKAYRFEEVVGNDAAPTQTIDTSNFITREEFDTKMAQLLGSIAAKNEPSKPTNTLL